MTPELEKAFGDFEATAKSKAPFKDVLATFDALMDVGSHEPEAAKQAAREQLVGLRFDWLRRRALMSAVAQLKRDEEREGQTAGGQDTMKRPVLPARLRPFLTAMATVEVVLGALLVRDSFVVMQEGVPVAELKGIILATVLILASVITLVVVTVLSKWKKD